MGYKYRLYKRKYLILRFGECRIKMNKKRIRRQLLILSLSLLVCLVSSVMIYLGATIFRSQIPFFQVWDGSDSQAGILEPKPEANPGVEDLETIDGLRLYMIFGTDFRPGGGYRTDTNILVAVDGKSGKASLVSFPRDLWVNIPGYGEQRLNTVMQTGGFQLFANTMQTNFGVYPTQYAMIDMPGFLRVIDVVGGIEFETEHYTGDVCERTLNPNKWCEVYPGTASMNSELALWYVRARYNSSDFDRMRRQQEVLKAVFDKVATPAGMVRMPLLMGIYESDIESNINPDQILPITNLALNFSSSEDVRRFTIGRDETTSWTTSGGAAVLLPNIPAIQAILSEALRFDW